MGAVLHLDLDSFFASVEQGMREDLKDKPVAISAARGQSVVVTASYEAKRSNVKVGMLKSEALKECPNLTFLLSRMGAYSGVSKRVHEIVEDYISYYETLGLDELFIELRDVSLEKLNLKGDVEITEVGRILGEEIRRRVKEELNINISAGVGSNKTTAKLATKLAKPDGILILKDQEEKDVLYRQKLDMITGIGPKSRKKLEEYGVEHMQDLLRFKKNELELICGKAQGRFIYNLVNFKNLGVVQAKLESKSMGVSRILRYNENDVDEMFEEIASELLQRLDKNDRGCKVIQLIVGYEKGYMVFKEKYDSYEKNKVKLLKSMRELYSKKRKDMKIIFLGITAYQLSRVEQLSIFEDSGVNELVEPPLIKEGENGEELYKRAYYGMKLRNENGEVGIVKGFKEGGIEVDFGEFKKIYEFENRLSE